MRAATSTQDPGTREREVASGALLTRHAATMYQLQVWKSIASSLLRVSIFRSWRTGGAGGGGFGKLAGTWNEALAAAAPTLASPCACGNGGKGAVAFGMPVSRSHGEGLLWS